MVILRKVLANRERRVSGNDTDELAFRPDLAIKKEDQVDEPKPSRRLHRVGQTSQLFNAITRLEV